MSESLRSLLEEVRASGDFAPVTEIIPYARLIGVSCQSLGEELLFCLAESEDNIGNRVLRAVHGGVLGGFMELAAGLHILLTTGTDTIPKVIDISIDYLRPARMQETFAVCEVIRQGRKLVNVNISAWQTRRDQPVATARAHFLLPASESP